MLTTSIKLVTAVFLAAALMGSAVDALAPPEDTGPPADRAPRTDLVGDPLPDGALARIGTLRWRHVGPVTFVGFGADGRQVVTASLGGYYRVWEVATGKEVQSLDRPLLNAAMPAPIPRRLRVGVPSEVPTSVVRSPDRRALAAAVADGTIRLWSIATGKESGRIGKTEDALAHGMNGIALAPDGKTLATRANDQIIRLWDLASGKEIRQLGKAGDDGQMQISYFGAIGNTLAFSSDGKMLAAMNSELLEKRHGTAVIWDVASGKEIQRINGMAGSLGGRIAFADVLVVAWGDHATRVYDPVTGKEIRQLGEQKTEVIIHSLVFSPDGKTLATRAASTDPAVQLWDIGTGKELRRMGTQPTAFGDNVFVKNNGGGSSCQTLDFSPDGKLLAEALPTNTVRLWDVDSGKEIQLAGGHDGAVAQAAVSADGMTLTTRSADRTIRHWDARTGKELHQHKLAEGAGAAVLSADGQRLAFGDARNVVHFWDAAAPKEVRTVEIPGQERLFDPDGRTGGLLALAPNGKIAAVRGEDGTIHLFDVASGKELRRPNIQALGAHAGIALVADPQRELQPPLCFTPDGTCVASVETAVYEDARLRRFARDRVYLCLCQVATGRLLRAFKWDAGSVSAFTLAPDGQTVVTVNGRDTVSVWEVLTGTECFRFKFKADPAAGPVVPQQPGEEDAPPVLSIRTLAVAPDGRILALGGTGPAIRLFDLGTGTELAQFAGHRGHVVSLAFAMDGRSLVSGSNDTTALVWDAGRYTRAAAAVVALTAEQAEDLWKDLGGDAAKAHQAIRALSVAPKEAVALLRERVQPTKGVDKKHIEQLVADLESERFTIRQKATEELEKLGELAEPALTKVLESHPGLETRQRIERILDNLPTVQTPPADLVRELRAVRALAQLHTPEARAMLQTLAQGAPGARLTREAQAALNRQASPAP